MKLDSNEMLKKWYSEDRQKAVDAKFEAQKMAFAPLAFQAVRALRDLGVLEIVDAAGESGVSKNEIEERCGITGYSADILIEMGLSCDILKLDLTADPVRYLLGKTGFFILHDPMTRANMDFTNDVCYKGGFYLEEALKQGKPEGLKVFGNWKTIYQGLSQLPPDVQKSWFQFDHYYSDGAFPEALEVVFAKPKKHLMDIGGNTAKWALSCWRHNSEVKVTIVDLPGQAQVAKRNIENMNAGDRVIIHEADILDPEAVLPADADAVWMSQFLDCFSLGEVTEICEKIAAAVDAACDIFVMEPLWDRQRYPAATYSLHATSLYFATMANGNSKMYNTAELVEAVCRAGFSLQEETHGVGPNDYSILRFRKKV